MGRKSFTLIELLVVIVIIAILAAIIAPHAFRAIEKAKISAIIGDIHSIKSAATAYYADTGTWPPDCDYWSYSQSFCPGFLTDDGKPGWNGPYLEKWPEAKWASSFWGYLFSRKDCAYSWMNWGITWKGVPYLYCGLELLYIPLAYARKIDLEIDGVIDDNAGIVAYGTYGGPTVVRVFISRWGSF